MISKERFYVATICDYADEIIREYDVGVEIDECCLSANLDSDKALTRAHNIAKLTEKRILHGPFTELTPSAIDPKALNLIYERLQQGYQWCQKLSIKNMVVHSGYIPFIYFKEWHQERSIHFWEDFMKDKAPDFRIYIENVLEDEPYMMAKMMESIEDERIKLCLDVGHSAVASNIKAGEWIDVLGEKIGHVHLHNNDGITDGHRALNDGVQDIDDILKEIDRVCSDETTITIETCHLKESFDWLKERGYI